eukprot:m.88560 g.88560  ORF g.88560 m.88560 type:complete len:452 (+) comp13173_c0_seq2:210-1565(+)
MASVVAIVLVALVILVVIVVLIARRKAGKPTVAVVVLGDLGRSPRMQYHTLSLAKNNDVDVIAYAGSRPLEAIVKSKNIRIHHIRTLPDLGLPFLLYAPLKVIFQTLQMVYILLIATPKPTATLVQNPPSIPTLPIVCCVCKLRGSKFVIDWHNYGYTILGLSLGTNHWLVKLSKFIEHQFGFRSDDNFCVTNAMRLDLHDNWGVQAKPLHDRPPSMFAPTPLSQRHSLFLQLTKEDKEDVFTPFVGDRKLERNATIFTNADGTLKKDRPVLIVSSTSWTADEDFGILLNALERYDKMENMPRLFCAITGKGPMKEYYKGVLKEKKLQNVKVAMLWLAIEDYPVLLGSCDMGISLHTSSSGLDLPMKVVDMFGCGLPVCAIHFKCLGELVRHKKNGLVFHNSDELAQQFKELFQKFPSDTSDLDQYRKELESFRKNGWDENWNLIASPVFS